LKNSSQFVKKGSECSLIGVSLPTPSKLHTHQWSTSGMCFITFKLKMAAKLFMIP
jgi:hypothetical protein